MDKRIVFYALLGMFAILIVVQLLNMDVNNLESKDNIGPLFSLGSSVLLVLALFISSKNVAKKKEKKCPL